MRTLVLFAALFVVACDKTSESTRQPQRPEAKLDPSIELPEVTTEPTAVEDEPVVVELTRDGLLQWEGKSVSLGAFQAALEGVAEARGVRASKLGLLLRSDREAPWQHVQWIFTMCAESKVYKTMFAATRAGKPVTVRAFLRVDVDRGLEEEPKELVVGIHIVSRKEERRVFGPKRYRQEVLTPTEVRFKLGARETADIAGVGRWVREAVKSARGVFADPRVRGEIRAGHKVPFRYVVAVLEQFHAAGLDTVDFYGTQIPTKELRAKEYLPYPKRNYARAD